MNSDVILVNTATEQFDIVFRGVREGADPAIVKQKFAQLFKLDAAKVERVFAAKKVTLKANLEEALANKYVSRLAAIGVIVDKKTVQGGRVLHFSHEQNNKVSAIPAAPSKAIYCRDYGDESSDCAAMHQPVEAAYGEFIHRIPFGFLGDGREYAKLWLVNLCISIASAGILFPWTQVRRQRYFYQHTQLAGSEFRYTANPQNIFLMQFVFFAVTLLLLYCFFLVPVFFMAMSFLVLLALPLYLHQRAVFHAAHSYYVDQPLRHESTLRQAYIHYLGWPLLAVFSGGLLAPYVAYKLQAYAVNAKSIGNIPLRFSAQFHQYLQLLPSLLAAEMLTAGIYHWNTTFPFWVSVSLLLLIWSYVFLRWRVLLINLQWNAVHSKLGHFVATWDLSSYAKLKLRNGVLCLLTAGLYWPWAKVRSAEYKAQHLAFFANQRFKKWKKSQTDANE